MSSTFRLALFGLLIVGMTASAHAQGGRGRRGFGGGFGGFGPASLVDLAMGEDVQKECEIVSDQVRDIEEIQAQIGQAMRNSRDELRDLPRDQLFTRLREMIAEANEDAEKKLGRVLLPHQMKRLKQIQFQSRTRGGVGGVARALESEELVDMLQISPEQQERIREVAEKAQEELEKELAKLRQEASEKVLAVLSPAQQKKWKDLAGEPFEFQPRDFGGRRGNFGRGGRGRGGQPGGRGRGRGRGADN